jgi:hypothetical protein
MAGEMIVTRRDEAWMMFDGMYEAHIMSVADAVRIAKMNDERNGRAFLFDGHEFTEIYPVYAREADLDPAILPWS